MTLVYKCHGNYKPDTGNFSFQLTDCRPHGNKVEGMHSVDLVGMRRSFEDELETLKGIRRRISGAREFMKEDFKEVVRERGKVTDDLKRFHESNEKVEWWLNPASEYVDDAIEKKKREIAEVHGRLSGKGVK